MASRLRSGSSSIAIRNVCVFCRQLRPAPRPHAPRLYRAAPPATGLPARYLSSSSTRRSPPSGSTSPPSKKPTYYALFPQTYPDGPPPAGKFTGSPRTLRSEFLKLQQTHHPDLQSQAVASSSSSSSSPSSNGAADAEDRTSAYINNAYRTLLDPLSRAEYVLELHGVDSRGEADKIDGGDFLMSVMEVTERIEDAEPAPLPAPELAAMKDENEQRKAACVLEIEQLFADARWTEAKESVVRLRYWEMVGKRIAEKM